MDNQESETIANKETLSISANRVGIVRNLCHHRSNISTKGCAEEAVAHVQLTQRTSSS